MAAAIGEIDETEAVRLYQEELWTLRRVADQLGTNHHRIRRALNRAGVPISSRQRRAPFTDEHRRRISEATKGRETWSKGLTLPESFCRNNMQGKLGRGIDVSEERYPDFDRLKMLTRQIAKGRRQIGPDDAARQAFLDRFYSDPAFNAVYDAWMRSGKSKWLFPSLDHKCPTSKGGDWSLDNLCFMTWFENRAKADMNADEWAAFKQVTGTKSDLFIESLCPSLSAAT